MSNIIKNTVFAFIPARAGSKGVPDKNIKPLGGHPLLAYSIVAALRAPGIDRVLVSTDSEAYRQTALRYGAEAPFLRPAYASGDKATDSDVLRHFLEWLQENEDGAPEYVVHLRPTTPFRDPALLGEALSLLRSSPDATALRSAHEMPETAYKCLEIADGRFRPVGADSFDMDAANLPRQNFPKTYTPNGYVDIILAERFLRTSSIHGDHVIPFLTDAVREVDTPEDFRLLEASLDTIPLSLSRALGGSD